MHLSCCTWALAGGDASEAAILDQLAALEFSHIDIRPNDFADEAGLARMSRLGFQVPCVALSFGLPAGVTLGSDDAEIADQALHFATLGLERATTLGATTAYIIPDLDASMEGLLRYGAAVTELASRAAERSINLCIEHFPGRALPTVANTLAFLEDVGHPNLNLLFDIGHAQMSKEDIRIAILKADQRLGYVHLDDNDGVGDLHWALCDGVMTQESLKSLFHALVEIEYDGGVSLEMNPTLPDPFDAIQRSRAVALQAWP
ncbi:MAG: sugar phosphate isomerase/epimerase [Caldilineaceae bacterium]|nr:sugar phosphate isomerase/epimerase [Caldilineaceae bacterium]